MNTLVCTPAAVRDGGYLDDAADEADFALDLPPELSPSGVGLDAAVLDAEVRTFALPASLHGCRLDKALVTLVPEFSRSYLQQLLEQGAVQVNGAMVAKPSAKVRLGDVLAVQMRPTAQSQAFRPERLSLDIVHEDEYLLVVNKPAGMVVHPAPGNWSGTLLNGLLAHHPGAALLPRAGIVHRLDKDTSGLMVVAKTRAVMDALVTLIARREVSRQYVALAHHAWQGAALRVVDAPVGRDPRNRLRMAVVDLERHPGKPARTDITCLHSTGTHCMVHCRLHTGRTHQIRVHMQSLGHPLVADVLYGAPPVGHFPLGQQGEVGAGAALSAAAREDAVLACAAPAHDAVAPGMGGGMSGGLRRQALHAFRLGFTHPATGAALVLYAPPPADFAAAVAGLDLLPGMQALAGLCSREAGEALVMPGGRGIGGAGVDTGDGVRGCAGAVAESWQAGGGGQAVVRAAAQSGGRLA